MTGPAKRRYILAASDAPALAHAAADVTNAMCVALHKAELERDELGMQLTLAHSDLAKAHDTIDVARAELAQVRAELAEARGARLSSVLGGCCEFIAQRDALLAQVAALTAEVAPLRELRAAADGARSVFTSEPVMRALFACIHGAYVKTENAPAVDRGASGA